MGLPDNGPLFVGTTWCFTFLSGLFMGLRMYAKLSHRKKLWWDDHFLIAAWIFLLIEAILMQMAQSIGYGKRTVDIDPVNLPKIALYSTVATSIAWFASTFSKISFGVTLLRLTMGLVRRFVWFCIIALLLVTVPSVLIIGIECSPAVKPWNSSIKGTCWGATLTVKYAIFNAAWCAAADFTLALLPWTLVWGLPLQLREKIGVGIAMSMGVLASICAIMKAVYMNEVRHSDFSNKSIELSIWAVAEIAVAIIGASIPVLRAILIHKVDSHSSSRSRSIAASTLKHIPTTSGTGRSDALNAMEQTRDVEGAWPGIELVEERSGDTSSRWSSREMTSDEETGIPVGGDERRGSQDGIWQMNTFGVEEESDRDGDGRGE